MSQNYRQSLHKITCVKANKILLFIFVFTIGVMPSVVLAGPHLPGQKTSAPTTVSQSPVTNSVTTNVNKAKVNSPISNSSLGTKSLSNKIYNKPQTNAGASSANLPSVQDNKKIPATTAAKAATNNITSKVGNVLKGKAINLVTAKEKSFVIDYNSYLVNKNGLKIKFYLTADNALLVAFIKNYNGKDYILNKVKVTGNNYTIDPLNIYSQEILKIRSFDKNTISIDIEDIGCPADFPNCFITSQLPSEIKSYKNGSYQYFYTGGLIDSSTVAKQFFDKKTNLDKTVVAFLQNKLGFLPPIDAYTYVYQYNPGITSAAGATNLFTIMYHPGNKITSDTVNQLTKGEPHEMTHIFLRNVNISGGSANFRWIEEGLASYMERLLTFMPKQLTCTDNGWSEDGGQTINPYTNYTNNSTNYSYKSHECFWQHIKDNYGENAIKKIGQALNNTRLAYPPQEKRFIHDIVNPVVGTDLSGLVQTRYGYSE